MLMAGFEPWSSGVVCANCATTTALPTYLEIFLSLKEFMIRVCSSFNSILQPRSSYFNSAKSLLRLAVNYSRVLQYRSIVFGGGGGRHNHAHTRLSFRETH